MTPVDLARLACWQDRFPLAPHGAVHSVKVAAANSGSSWMFANSSDGPTRSRETVERKLFAAGFSSLRIRITLSLVVWSLHRRRRPGEDCLAHDRFTAALMAKSGAKRVLVKLRSTAGTGFVYVTTKNKVNDRERMEIRKYDPKIRQHVMFREER